MTGTFCSFGGLGNTGVMLLIRAALGPIVRLRTLSCGFPVFGLSAASFGLRAEPYRTTRAQSIHPTRESCVDAYIYIYIYVYTHVLCVCIYIYIS